MSELWLQGFAARDHPDGRGHDVVRFRWRIELRRRWRWRRWIELWRRVGGRGRGRGELLAAGGWRAGPRGVGVCPKKVVRVPHWDPGYIWRVSSKFSVPSACT